MSSTGAVNGGGSRKSYEAFETYGDTLLKFLSTFYVFKKFDNKNSLSKMRLKDISQEKGILITNQYLQEKGR